LVVLLAGTAEGRFLSAAPELVGMPGCHADHMSQSGEFSRKLWVCGRKGSTFN